MSFDMKQIVSVKNRSSGMVVYQIPEHNIYREFYQGETKQIPYEELVWLSYQPGGRNLMQDMLLIKNENATDSLNVHTEPEYFMSEEDVINLLKNGTMDEFLDALDFAPKGVIQLIKDLAVSLPLYDMQKREAIQKATGFNVSAAIENAKPDPEDEAEEVKAPAATRRVQKNSETPNAPQRRTSGKYTVVAPKE
jgi:hypothetical protein